MGEHPGKVIKNIATIMYLVTTLILFLLFNRLSPTMEFIGFLIAIPLSLIASYIVWLPIYAIGHLLCKVDEIAESAKNTEEYTEGILSNIENNTTDK